MSKTDLFSFEEMFLVPNFHDTICLGLRTYMKYCITQSGVDDLVI